MTSGRLATRFRYDKVLLLDGAMGTELERRGAHTYLPLWSAWGLIKHPDVVKAIHADYARAGADILVTNTFRTTGRMLSRAGRDPGEARQLDSLAVRLAQEAAAEAGSDALIAGSIAPLEDCYSPWLSPDPDIALAEHRWQAKNLAEAGVDFILVETMPMIAEAHSAAIAGIETGLDVVVGLVLGPDGTLISGEKLEDAVLRLEPLGVKAIVVNCSPQNVVTEAMSRLAELTSLPFGGYANLGVVDETVGWNPDQSVSGASYAAEAVRWVAAGASFVGGCCGTTPAHIHALRAALDLHLRSI